MVIKEIKNFSNSQSWILVCFIGLLLFLYTKSFTYLLFNTPGLPYYIRVGFSKGSTSENWGKLESLSTQGFEEDLIL